MRSGAKRLTLQHALSGATCALLAACLLTQAVAANAQPQATETLYLDAMQAIAEGRKNDASRILQKMVAQEPKHAGAWLDLALIQCELGHVSEAERLFAEIEIRFAPPLEIMQVISARRSAGCKLKLAPSHWNVMLARGYEQNVNQGASSTTYSAVSNGRPIELPLLPDFLPKPDRYLLLAADYSRELNQNGSILFSQLQARRNDTLNQYDSASLFVGVEQPARFYNWALRGGAMVGMLSLGGQLYQKQTQLQLKAIPPWRLPENYQLQLSASLNHLKYSTLTNFDANTLELRAQLHYKKGELFAAGGLAFLNDHAIGERPGGRRHGWAVNLMASTPLPYHLRGEAAWLRQTWVGQTPYAPPSILQVRDQNMQTLRLALIKPIDDHQSWQLEWRAVANKENISIFQYNNRQLQLSWLWQNR